MYREKTVLLVGFWPINDLKILTLVDDKGLKLQLMLKIFSMLTKKVLIH
jgi:hypothetical protein